MKKQVVVIHGGDSFNTYEEYLKDLKKSKITLEGLRGDWKIKLGDSLGKGFDVLLPKMPNSYNARYIEWKIWFEKIIPLLNKEVTLVGHSQGGIFLAKYLSENKFPKKIRVLILVAAPYIKTPNIGDFALKKPLSSVAKQCKVIHLFQSKDDPIVPYSEVEKYKKELSNAHLHIFQTRGHFNQKTFPEIVEIIKEC